MAARKSLTPISKSPPAPESYPVFVVEDEPGISRLVQKTLAAAGYRVTCFETAEALLERVGDVESPILVADVRLPGINGLELVEAVAEIRDDFEVVVMTAHADVEVLARAIELGIFRCLAKPFAVGDLKLSVAGAANRLFLRLDRRAHLEVLEERNRSLTETLEQLQKSESRRVLTERLASIGQFAASLAHEINNPLSYVQTNVALLNDGAPTLVSAMQEVVDSEMWKQVEPGVAEAASRFVFELPAVLEECETGLRLMREISSDLSSVARYRTDTEEVFDLNDVVRTAARVARVESRLRARLELELGSERLPVRGSPGRLAQVVMNLIGNAGDATAPDRPNVITVRTQSEEKLIHLEVADTGIGMSTEVQKRVFEPFVTYREGGTGIGLGLVREIVAELGGSISVESQAGVGTKFKASLPIAEGDVARRRGAPMRRRLPAGLKLLVVEDDPLVRRAFQRAFRQLELRFAENGSVALREIFQERPDLIVSDLQMPEMDGVTFFESVASQWPELSRRMLFISGTEALIQRARARAPGRPLVRKPFDIASLETTLAELLTGVSPR